MAQMRKPIMGCALTLCALLGCCGPANSDIPKDEAIEYIRASMTIADASDAVLETVLDEEYEGVPFLTWVSALRTADKAYYHTSKGQYSYVVKDIADATLPKVLAKSGYQSVGAVAFSASLIYDSLDAWLETVKKAGFDAQMKAYFAYRDRGCTHEEIANKDEILPPHDDSGWLIPPGGTTYLGWKPGYMKMTPEEFFEVAKWLYEDARARGALDSDRDGIGTAMREAIERAIEGDEASEDLLEKLADWVADIAAKIKGWFCPVAYAAGGGYEMYLASGDYSGVWPNESPAARITKECIYAVLPGVEVLAGTIALKPAATGWACVARRGDKEFIILDGNEQKGYDGADSPTFSPDGNRLAYVARSGDKKFVVLDGVEQKKYEWVSGPIFSPEGGRFAYRARFGKKQFAVLDGVEQKGYERVLWYPTFSADGRRFGYVAGLQDKEFVVLDGVEQKRYNSAWNLTFSADGRRYAYHAESGDTGLIVLDGTEQKSYDWARDPTFSPTGTRFAYAARSGRREFVILDGVKQKEYDAVTHSRSFSPNGERFAYVAKSDGREFVVLDGVEQKKHDRYCVIPAFSPDGTRFAYTTWGLDGKHFVVLDGAEQKCHDRPCQDLSFSVDGRRFVYVVQSSLDDSRDESFVVLDGTEQEKLDEIIYLSADASGQERFVWCGWKGELRKDEEESLRWWQPGSRLYRFRARLD